MPQTHLVASTVDEPWGQSINGGEFVVNPLTATYVRNDPFGLLW